jgi:hypothetical protein
VHADPKQFTVEGECHRAIVRAGHQSWEEKHQSLVERCQIPMEGHCNRKRLRPSIQGHPRLEGPIAVVEEHVEVVHGVPRHAPSKSGPPG